MPCQSDYLAASGQEFESKRVCDLIIYVHGRLEIDIPEWVRQAAEDYYGNVNRLDEATQILCATCRSMSPREKGNIIYNARIKKSRNLADWWERHQEWDERRVEEEKETRRKIHLRERALKKLTNDELKALDLI